MCVYVYTYVCFKEDTCEKDLLICCIIIMLENLKDQDDLNAILSFIAVYRLLLLRCL